MNLPGQWVIFLIATGSSMLVPSHGTQAQDQVIQLDAKGDQEVKLPMDSEMVVFQMDMTGGFRRRLPGLEQFQPTPRLRVFADGRVVTGQREAAAKEYEYHMNDEELQKFMHRVVNEFHFFDFNTESIRDQLIENNGMNVIADATTTEFSVQLLDKKHQISVYALNFLATQFPQINGMPELYQLEKLAVRMEGIARIGGPDRLEELIEIANEYAAREGHQLKIQTEHLVTASRAKSGELSVYLVIPSAADNVEQGWNVSLNEGLDGKVEIQLRRSHSAPSR